MKKKLKNYSESSIEMNKNMELTQLIKTYYKNGWSVFPVKPLTKIPDCVWTEDYFTEEQMLAYIETHPDTNLAIRTGRESKVVVVDIDDPKRVGEYLDRFPTGLVAMSPRGGYHLYYSQSGSDGELRNRVGVEPGIDFRGDGGYVLVAPSVVKYENGKIGDYSWESTDRPARIYPDLVKKMTERVITLDHEVSGQAALLQRIVTQGFTPHQHNQELFQLGAYFAGTGTPFPIAKAFLLELDAKDPTPQGKAVVVSTLESAYNRVAADKKKEKSPITQVSSGDFNTVNAGQLLAQFADYDVDWIYDGWLPRSSIIMVAAPPENMKSWLTLDIATSLALGVPFMGIQPSSNKGERVLVVQQEDFEGLTAMRLRTILAEKMRGKVDWHVNPDGSWYCDLEYFDRRDRIDIYVDNMLSLEDDASIEGLRRKIEQTRPSLITIDPFYMFAGSPGDFFAEAARKFRPLKRMRTEYGSSFLIAHHTKKGDQGDKREKIWGSQLLNGVIEGAWLVQKDEDSGIQVVRSGKFFKGSTAVHVNFDINTEISGERYLTTVEDSTVDLPGKYDKQIYEVLKTAKKAMRQVDIATELEISRAAAKQALDKMVVRGILIKNEHDLYFIKPVEGGF